VAGQYERSSRSGAAEETVHNGSIPFPIPLPNKRRTMTKHSGKRMYELIGDPHVQSGKIATGPWERLASEQLLAGPCGASPSVDSAQVKIFRRYREGDVREDYQTQGQISPRGRTCWLEIAKGSVLRQWP
jgi:hypothetical protein